MREESKAHMIELKNRIGIELSSSNDRALKIILPQFCKIVKDESWQCWWIIYTDYSGEITPLLSFPLGSYKEDEIVDVFLDYGMKGL